MKSTISIRRRATFAVAVATALVGLLSAHVQARDTDIYFTDPAASGLKPNILMVLDTSGSMNEEVGSGMSRLDQMKQALKTFIDDSANINVGLMRFSRSEGGAVVYPVSDLDADVIDDGNLIVAMQNSSDDASEITSGAGTGTVTTTSTTHTFSPSNAVGIRFRDVYVPQGATITSARLTFVASSGDSGSTNMTISLDDADNAPTYTTAANDITTRAILPLAQTPAVSWNSVPSWTSGTRYYSPDLSTIVGLVTSRAGWQSGNSLAFTLATTTGQRTAYAYDRYISGSFENRSPKLIITYDASTVSPIAACDRTVVARVKLGTDDAEQRVSTGGMTTAQSNSNPIQLTKSGSNDQLVGIRFQDLQIPQGATIVSANMEFTIRSNNTAAASLAIVGQNSDNAPTFTGNNSDISTRPTTSTPVLWNNLPTTLGNNDLLTTPDIKGVVQDIVNRPGWANSNAMAFIISAQGAASGPRNVYSFEMSPGKAPFLRVAYTAQCTTRKARDEMKAAIVAMTAGGSTPIVDALYEGALYLRGDAVDYGAVRENGGTNTNLLRVSHALSYSGGALTQPVGCSNTDIEADACKGEQITSGPTYISPVTAACQSTHMILLTDGAATANTSSTKVRTMAGASTCSGTGNEACGVTLTTYLSNQDQLGFDGTQVIKTHTIGFNFSSQFIQDLASTGDGSFHTVNDASELTSAFQEILNQVLSDPTGFVSPSLTVNAFNKLYNQNDVYFSLFSPQFSVGWPGNVKKYKLCDIGDVPACVFGEVVDVDGIPSVDANTSKIKTTAKSYWSTSPDGPTVDLGGAGTQIPAYTLGTRKVYTYTDVGVGADGPFSPPVDLTAAAHVVNQGAIGAPDNPALSKTLLGNAAMTDTEYFNLVRWMRGQDVQDNNNNGSTTDDRWKFADALHSRPATMTYGGTAANPVLKIFVGTNDGGLRMINGASGVEEWIVYLPEFLPNVKALFDNNNAEHIIGLDAAPSLWFVDNNNDGTIDPGLGDKVYLFIGMRRGGRDIYAFDVTPDGGIPVTTPTAIGEIKPKFLWRIKGGTGGDFAGLGQTWSYPQVATIRVKCPALDPSCDDGVPATLDSKKKPVLIFGGGYDPGQDGVIPPGVDAQGNGIYIVDPEDGSLIWRAGGTGSGAPLVLAEMKYAIASDVGMIDSNGDGAVDRLHVGDTRGQVFRIDLGDQIDPAGGTLVLKNGGSSGYVFADIGCTGGVRKNLSDPTKDNCADTVASDRRKFFYPPAIVPTRDTTYSTTGDYDLVAMGSGDREDPVDKITDSLIPPIEPVHNRIYGFRDYNYQFGPPISTPTTLTDANLYDSTSNALQDPSGGVVYDNAVIDIQGKDGWFVDLKEPTVPEWIGEKALARPTVFAGILYATTYVPPTGGAPAPGVCPPPAEGVARLYGLNYLTGAGVADLNGDGIIDRFVEIGGGIPSDVVIVIREGGVSGLIGTSGGSSSGSSNPGGKQWKIGGATPRYPTFWYDD